MLTVRSFPAKAVDLPQSFKRADCKGIQETRFKQFQRLGFADPFLGTRKFGRIGNVHFVFECHPGYSSDMLKLNRLTEKAYLIRSVIC